MALLKAIEVLLLEEEEKASRNRFDDQDFINRNTQGYAGFAQDLKQYNAEKLAHAGGHIICAGAGSSAGAREVRRKSSLAGPWGLPSTKTRWIP